MAPVFLYPSPGGMEPLTQREQAWQEAERRAMQRKSHPLTRCLYDARDLPNRVEIAWMVFQAWRDLANLCEKLEEVGLRTKKSRFGLNERFTQSRFLSIFGVTEAGSELRDRMQELRRHYNQEKVYVDLKSSDDAFVQFCELLYEIRSVHLDNPLLYIAERCGGDPLEEDG